MNNIKIIFQYDGTNYYGFQRQNNKPTVQAAIEKILCKITKEKINLISAGRTDRSVHASMQVSNFLTELNLAEEKWLYILNKALPRDIRILKVEKVDLNFNSRFDAKLREYEYFLTWDSSAFKSKYFAYVEKEVDCKILEKILAPLIGKHDFINFRLTDKVEKSSVREIYSIEVSKLDKTSIKIKIAANSFLKSQIRIIVGTALEIYFNKIAKDTIEIMLLHTDKKFKKKLAPPEGLFLSKIIY